MKISNKCKLFKLAIVQLKREGKGKPVKVGEFTIFEHDVADIFDTMHKILINANKRNIDL